VPVLRSWLAHLRRRSGQRPWRWFVSGFGVNTLYIPTSRPRRDRGWKTVRKVLNSTGDLRPRALITGVYNVRPRSAFFLVQSHRGLLTAISSTRSTKAEHWAFSGRGPVTTTVARFGSVRRLEGKKENTAPGGLGMVGAREPWV